MSSLFLNTNEDTFSIHPVVVLSVLDSFKRRREGQGRVLGCLLGYRENNKVSIEESFVIPHVEEENEVKVNVDFAHVEKAYSLYCQANPRLNVVGWYSTNTVINTVSCLINKELMDRFNCVNPVLVTIDTGLQNNRLTIAGYTAKIVTIDNKPFHIRFEPVPIETKSFEAERIALDAILNGNPDNDAIDAPAALSSDTEALDSAMSQLSHHFDQIGAFLKQITDNKVGYKDCLDTVACSMHLWTCFRV